MTDGYTTSRGLGKGLPGSRRLVDDFEIESVVGEGTTIRIAKWL
jgi:serine/threonine-protein kinase RsbT